MKAVRLRAKSGSGLVMRRRLRRQPSAPPPPPPPQRPAAVPPTGRRRFPRASARSMAGLRRGGSARSRSTRGGPRSLGRRSGSDRPGAAAPPHQHPDFVAASALRGRARRVARRSRGYRTGTDRCHAAPGDRSAGNRSARIGRAGRPHPAGRRRWRGAWIARTRAGRGAERAPQPHPAENLRGFEEAVHALSHKIDQIAASGNAPQGDPMAFKQLEQAVVSLRGVVSNVASDGALSQLAAEVRGLGAQFERATAESSTEALAKLEARIAALMESGRAVPPELEGSVRALERAARPHATQPGRSACARRARGPHCQTFGEARRLRFPARPSGGHRARAWRSVGLSRGDAERRLARASCPAGRAGSRPGCAATSGSRSTRRGSARPAPAAGLPRNRRSI